MNTKQKQQVAATASQAFELPSMTEVPVQNVAAILAFPWIKVTKQADGYYVQAERTSYMVR